MADTNRFQDGGLYVEQVSGLPATGVTNAVVSFNGSLYRWTGTAWVPMTGAIASAGAADSDGDDRQATNSVAEVTLFTTTIQNVVRGMQLQWSVGAFVFYAAGNVTLRAKWTDGSGSNAMATMVFTPGGGTAELFCHGDGFVEPDDAKGDFFRGKGCMIPHQELPVADFNGSATWDGASVGVFSLSAQWSVADPGNTFSADNYALRVFRP